MMELKSELAARLVDRDPARASAELVDVQRVTRQARSHEKAYVVEGLP